MKPDIDPKDYDFIHSVSVIFDVYCLLWAILLFKAKEYRVNMTVKQRVK